MWYIILYTAVKLVPAVHASHLVSAHSQHYLRHRSGCFLFHKKPLCCFLMQSVSVSVLYVNLSITSHLQEKPHECYCRLHVYDTENVH